MQILPRLIRKSDAPAYLGMNKNEFTKTVEPNVVAVPIGIQGVAFDRLDLDEWVTHYKQDVGFQRINGRRVPAANIPKTGPVERKHKEISTWQERISPVLRSGQVPGTSTNKLRGTDDFAKALAQATGKKQKAT
ncbi:MAG: hypothetical protein NT086_16330 [Proteobacteria bacterium]|nr:hypothetical protein [Pseudomonadota bacterium]